ncbi:MAG: Enoyl-CoA hydratase [Frankiales bacterium]|nr:Enoyl-CoA hydratase [Frankiales bacterium]
MSQELSTIRREQADGVVRITLDRPAQLNAITGVMLDELIATLEQCAADPETRVLVLTGAGRAFCAGGDLHSSGGSANEGRIETSVASSRRALRVSELLRSMPQPVIAVINGACAGAGLSWACAADLRVAADTAVFVTAFTAAGVGGDHGVSWLLPRIVGLGRAAELLLLSERFSAQRAAELGLVSAVVPAEQLAELSERWTSRLLSLAPGALASMKANLREGQSISFAESLDREAERLIHAFRHPDSVEAAQAFFEGRPPRFAR